MNRTKRAAAALAVSAWTLAVPVATVAPASAEPYPWHDPDAASQQAKTKAQVEYEERLHLQREHEVPPAEPPASEETGFPWNTVALVALGAGALAAGGVVVVRRPRHEPRTA